MTSKKQTPMREELLEHYTSLERSLVQLIFKALAPLPGQGPFGPELLNPESDRELADNLRWLRKQKRRWLIRLALTAHEWLDRNRQFRDFSYTLYLYLRLIVKPLRALKRAFKYNEWAKRHQQFEASHSILNRKITFVADQDRLERLRRALPPSFRQSQTISFVTSEKLLGLEVSDQEQVVLVSADGQPSQHLCNDLLLEQAASQSQLNTPEILYADADVRRWGLFSKPELRASWDPDFHAARNMFSEIAWLNGAAFNKLQQSLAQQQKLSQFFASLVFKSDEFHIRHIPHIWFHRKSRIKNSQLKAWHKTVKDQVSEGLVFERRKSGRYPSLFSTNNEPKVSIIIPTKDAIGLVKTLMEGLQKTRYSNKEILIVDNNSQQVESKQYFKELEAEGVARVLEYPGAFNFSAINNFAVNQASGEYLLFLNNDIEVLHDDWLANMVALAGRERVGAVGAKLLYRNRFVQHAGVVIGLQQAAGHVHRQFHHWERGLNDRLLFTHECSAATAACLMVKKESFEQVGGFNAKDLTVAYNDIDLCLKLKEIGLRILYTPEAQLLHLESVSRPMDLRPEQLKRYMKELGFMQQRWSTYLDNDPFYNQNLSKNCYTFQMEG